MTVALRRLFNDKIMSLINQMEQSCSLRMRRCGITPIKQSGVHGLLIDLEIMPIKKRKAEPGIIFVTDSECRQANWSQLVSRRFNRMVKSLKEQVCQA